jgi:pimeloyl-ACP methyl ester carboxylesterase
LHYWGGSSQTWNEVISSLRDRFRCVAIDARGAGESDAPASGYSAADHAGDALNVIRSLGLNSFNLVGHSMGGKTAQALAAQRPQDLAGLVLVASSPPSPMAIGEEQRAQMKRAYADRAAVEWSLDNVLLGSPVSSEVRARLIADSLRLSPQATAGWIEIGSREDFSQKVGKIDVPVGIIAGELDRVDPVAVVKAHVVARYPSATVRYLPGKGHLLPVEAPQEVADIIRFIAETQNPRAA